jgi:(S)-2-hydroxyglutarate dehydrogenase
VVIGAGAIGASAAFHLARRGVRVVVVEKERQPAQHQSGRNSGVIHAGYNLKPGSLKARYCVEGSRQLRVYCRDHGIAMHEGGILIVARTDAELVTLTELHRRAKGNGVQARLVSENEIRDIEPHACGMAGLHAPEGASFDATAYVRSLLAEAAKDGAEIRYATAVRRVHEGLALQVETSAGTLSAGVVLNCAGLYADRIAGPVARDLRIIPFRGYYAELRPPRRALVTSHVYGSPDLTFPFLGVHFSRRVDGRVIVGPGAMLAFGREAYRFAQVNVRDLASTLLWPGFYRLMRESRFRSLIVNEVQKSLSLSALSREAQMLIPELRPSDLVRSLAGNRAQVVSRDGHLVDDIVVRETAATVHVLNAVSPGLTCSLPFGQYLADLCQSRLTFRTVPTRREETGVNRG